MIHTDEKIIDVKLLEFSNSIDLWEGKNLCSKSGFYADKGKNAVENYSKYLSNLNDFALNEIERLNLNCNDELFQLANTIKDKKIETIQKGLNAHLKNELRNYAIDVCKSAQNFAIEKGVSYRNSNDMIDVAYRNGKTATTLLKEYCDDEFASLENFSKRFYTSCMLSLIKDESAHAKQFFDTHKQHFDDNFLDEFDSAIKKCELKNEVSIKIDELFKMHENAARIEISRIIDPDVKEIVSSIYEIKTNASIKAQDMAKRNLIDISWQNVIDTKSVECVNFALGYELAKNQLQYIEEFQKYGEILTEPSIYLDIRDLSIYNLDDFLNLDLICFSNSLSKSDMELFENRQKSFASVDFNVAREDGMLIDKLLSRLSLNDKERYEIIKSIENDFLYFKMLNSKMPQRNERKQIIIEKIADYSNLIKENKGA